MSKTKNTGGTKLGRDSDPKYLGIKVADGQSVKVGSIIVRQRGTRFLAGANVRTGSDHTLYAVAVGKVVFRVIRKKGFNNTQRMAKVVDVVSAEKK